MWQFSEPGEITLIHKGHDRQNILAWPPNSGPSPAVDNLVLHR